MALIGMKVEVLASVQTPCVHYSIQEIVPRRRLRRSTAAIPTRHFRGSINQPSLLEKTEFVLSTSMDESIDGMLEQSDSCILTSQLLDQ